MFKIFVRWNFDEDGYHKIDITLNGQIIHTSGVICNNTDRIYGYCLGVVAMFQLMGIYIEMPRCLTNRHLTPDMSRED
jgi:hypothetical protein